MQARRGVLQTLIDDQQLFDDHQKFITLAGELS